MNSLLAVNFLAVVFAVGALTFIAGCKGSADEKTDQDSGSNNRLTVNESEQGNECDIEIATFLVPDGWNYFASSGMTSALLIPSDQDPNSTEQMITVDVGQAKFETVNETATTFASIFGGKVADSNCSFDGVPAAQIFAPAKAGELTPRVSLMVHHNGQLINLGLATKDVEPTGYLLERIAETWKWK